jgi:hypothetical protein
MSQDDNGNKLGMYNQNKTRSPRQMASTPHKNAATLSHSRRVPTRTTTEISLALPLNNASHSATHLLQTFAVIYPSRSTPCKPSPVLSSPPTSTHNRNNNQSSGSSSAACHHLNYREPNHLNYLLLSSSPTPTPPALPLPPHPPISFLSHPRTPITFHHGPARQPRPPPVPHSDLPSSPHIPFKPQTHQKHHETQPNQTLTPQNSTKTETAVRTDFTKPSEEIPVARNYAHAPATPLSLSLCLSPPLPLR